MDIKEGLFTFNAEGDDIPNSLYFSRKIHWPGNPAICKDIASGVTIGRGFDLGQRTQSESYYHLMSAGIPQEKAMMISEGSGMHGCEASDFVTRNRDKIGEITHFQQANLFKISFPSYITRARGFYNRYKNSNAVSWDNMDERMRDIFIDMIYQGSMRIRYVSFFEENNPDAVISLIKNTSSLAAYDKSRKRVIYLKGAE
ncbi:pesticin C-terminus-like muramidase [Dickeya solani]|uniref:Pesticin C-terminus-like muramidase n=1 Tax=Dickeya solani TaxID=1089444 RepID=A0ABU4EF07_9GAMM|nr:pesticin C-terminus-like muramidase [Dickeya solani]MCA7001522.1 pesticin C-terminus-like muramidase [Dickeya solani]MCZ0820834.1 pesticin C-terminus-like muramidase [Dickeya solani]MDV6996898.1 pesticin C-terminus-like muramidase [Dickeya solani]MDV7002630.1 pesticin C-terminus-like muramidase [Dickeya solani]MDV7038720.1 pesticin C-terminus-like muramidase [Dickeya solani]